MKDHPEEFVRQCKWDTLIEDFRDNFTLDEWEAYKAARNEMMRDLFNESVLKRLAGEEDSDIEKARATVGKMASTFGTTDPRAMYGQLVNTPQLAAKQANAAMQQEAYNAAIQQRLYHEQRGMLNSAGSLGNTRLFGL
jgi:hypothetical protein